MHSVQWTETSPLRQIKLFELRTISDAFLNSIYLFLKENKNSDIIFIALHLAKGNNHISDMEMKCTLHQTKFNSIGFHGHCVKDDKRYGTQKLVVQKMIIESDNIKSM